MENAKETMGRGPEASSEARAERALDAAWAITEAGLDAARVWASYGLRVGKLAVETHAHVLGRVADALFALDAAIATADAQAVTREGEALAEPSASEPSAPSVEGA